MNMSSAEYLRFSERLAPRSPVGKNCLNAFWTGGLICVLGQLLTNGFLAMELPLRVASCGASTCLVFLAALLTGLSVFDDIAKLAGAGTMVPITGFANSIAAPAVEFRTEGFVTGLAVKMFTIAGPVLVYGTFAGWIYGLIYWLCTQVLKP